MPFIIIAFYLVILAITVLGAIFWIWMIVDCATNEPSEGNDKVIWILVVILAGWIGGAIYYFVRRPERIKKFGK
ncbi:PLDc N-terminal domain-containing protein [candidate division WOR-3 bacterium]|nr:PLDc N-terminal domain-containing protein [candidate division WOR-3 bacterium]